MKKYYEKNKKIINEEQKKKISETLKQKYRNGEMKITPPSPNLTGKWWNNGQVCKRSVECPGDEWKRGRLF